MHEIGRSWQAALFGEECNTLTPPQIASDGADNESTTVAVCDLRDSRVRLAILQQKGSGSHRATRAGASRLQGKRKSREPGSPLSHSPAAGRRQQLILRNCRTIESSIACC